MKRTIVIPHEHQTLADELGVTEHVVSALSRWCEGPMTPLQPRTERGRAIKVNAAPAAMMVAFRGIPIDTHVWELSDAVASAGLRVFLCAGRQSTGEAYEMRSVALIRRDDPWDAIRAVGTAAPKAGIDTNEILATLQAWDAEWGFQIRGAGPDWFEFYCARGSGRMAELAAEANRRWPALVRSGHGSVEVLQQQMESLACFWLFWRR